MLKKRGPGKAGHRILSRRLVVLRADQGWHSRGGLYYYEKDATEEPRGVVPLRSILRVRKAKCLDRNTGGQPP